MCMYTIYSFTVIRTSGEEFLDKQPYLCGLIEDEQGNRRVAYLDRFDEQQEVKIGARVELKSVDDQGLEIFGLIA